MRRLRDAIQESLDGVLLKYLLKRCANQSGSVSNNQTSGDKFAAFLGTLKGL
jgi:hypothetical protein